MENILDPNLINYLKKKLNKDILKKLNNVPLEKSKPIPGVHVPQFGNLLQCQGRRRFLLWLQEHWHQFRSSFH